MSIIFLLVFLHSTFLSVLTHFVVYYDIKCVFKNEQGSLLNKVEEESTGQVISSRPIKSEKKTNIKSM